MFKFNFRDFSDSLINEVLGSIGLTSFHHRKIPRLLIFIAKMCSYPCAPTHLKNILARSSLVNDNHEQRSNEKVLVLTDRAYTKYGDITFKHFCGKIINNMTNLNFYDNFFNFKKFLYDNTNELIKKFKQMYCKFNLNLNFLFFRDNLNDAFMK